MYEIKQSTAETILMFIHDSAGDAVTGLTNGSFTKRISKGSGAFGAMTVTITEGENGWYSFPLSTSHSDALGLLSITFTNAGAKQVNLQWRVEAKLTDDLNDAITAPTAVQNRTEMDSNSTQLAAIVGDTVDIQSKVDKIPLSDGVITWNATALASINAQADLALTDYDGPTNAEMIARTILAANYFDPANDAVANVTLTATTTTVTDGAKSAALSTVDSNVDAILLDTAEIGTSGAGLTDLGGMSTGMKAEVLAEVVKLFTTQMTESYSADGVAPTLTQALMLTLQNLQEPSYSGVTQTVKQLDGSTTAATYTMDDATNPTNKTRAT